MKTRTRGFEMIRETERGFRGVCECQEARTERGWGEAKSNGYGLGGGG